MTLPLMCRIYDEELELLFHQPITEQAFPVLNPWKHHPVQPKFEVFDVEREAFVPFSLWEPLRLPLPLRRIPVFKYAGVTNIHCPQDIALDVRDLSPISSMKVEIGTTFRSYGRQAFLRPAPACTPRML